jgi:hypothetical protein
VTWCFLLVESDVQGKFNAERVRKVVAPWRGSLSRGEGQPQIELHLGDLAKTAVSDDNT